MRAAGVAPRPPGTASQCGLPPATTEMSLAWVARGLSFAATLPEGGFPFLRRKKNVRNLPQPGCPSPPVRTEQREASGGRHGWQAACPWLPGTPPGTQRFPLKAQLPAAAPAWGEQGSAGVSDPGRCQPPLDSRGQQRGRRAPGGLAWEPACLETGFKHERKGKTRSVASEPKPVLQSEWN